MRSVRQILHALWRRVTTVESVRDEDDEKPGEGLWRPAAPVACFLVAFDTIVKRGRKFLMRLRAMRGARNGISGLPKLCHGQTA